MAPQSRKSKRQRPKLNLAEDSFSSGDDGKTKKRAPSAGAKQPEPAPIGGGGGDGNDAASSDNESEFSELEVPYKLDFGTQTDKAPKKDGESSDSSDDEGFDPTIENKATEPLRPGDIIEYTAPISVAGSRQGQRRAQVWSIQADREPFPVQLSNGESIYPDHIIKRIAEYRQGQLYKHPGFLKAMNNFRWKEGVFQNDPAKASAVAGILAQIERQKRTRQQFQEELQQGWKDSAAVLTKKKKKTKRSKRKNDDDDSSDDDSSSSNNDDDDSSSDDGVDTQTFVTSTQEEKNSAANALIRLQKTPAGNTSAVDSKKKFELSSEDDDSDDDEESEAPQKPTKTNRKATSTKKNSKSKKGTENKDPQIASPRNEAFATKKDTTFQSTTQSQDSDFEIFPKGKSPKSTPKHSKSSSSLDSGGWLERKLPPKAPSSSQSKSSGLSLSKFPSAPASHTKKSPSQQNDTDPAVLKTFERLTGLSQSSLSSERSSRRERKAKQTDKDSEQDRSRQSSTKPTDDPHAKQKKSRRSYSERELGLASLSDDDDESSVDSLVDKPALRKPSPKAAQPSPVNKSPVVSSGIAMTTSPQPMSTEKPKGPNKASFLAGLSSDESESEDEEEKKEESRAVLKESSISQKSNSLKPPASPNAKSRTSTMERQSRRPTIDSTISPELNPVRSTRSVRSHLTPLETTTIGPPVDEESDEEEEDYRLRAQREKQLSTKRRKTEKAQKKKSSDTKEKVKKKPNKTEAFDNDSSEDEEISPVETGRKFFAGDDQLLTLASKKRKKKQVDSDVEVLDNIDRTKPEEATSRKKGLKVNPRPKSSAIVRSHQDLLSSDDDDDENTPVCEDRRTLFAQRQNGPTAHTGRGAKSSAGTSVLDLSVSSDEEQGLVKDPKNKKNGLKVNLKPKSSAVVRSQDSLSSDEEENSPMPEGGRNFFAQSKTRSPARAGLEAVSKKKSKGRGGAKSGTASAFDLSNSSSDEDEEVIVKASDRKKEGTKVTAATKRPKPKKITAVEKSKRKRADTESAYSTPFAAKKKIKMDKSAKFMKRTATAKNGRPVIDIGDDDIEEEEEKRTPLGTARNKYVKLNGRTKYRKQQQQKGGQQ
jgi:hypothetical protein